MFVLQNTKGNCTRNVRDKEIMKYDQQYILIHFAEQNVESKCIKTSNVHFTTCLCRGTLTNMSSQEK